MAAIVCSISALKRSTTTPWSNTGSATGCFCTFGTGGVPPGAVVVVAGTVVTGPAAEGMDVPVVLLVAAVDGGAVVTGGSVTGGGVWADAPEAPAMAATA